MIYYDKSLYLSANAPDDLRAFVDQRGVDMGLIISRYEHSRERASERYGIDLTYDEWEAMNFAIFRDDPEIVTYVDSGNKEGSSLYTIKRNNDTLMVAYSDTAFLILTVHPRSDLRLRSTQQGRYRPNTLSGTAMEYVEARQAVAARFDPATARPFEALASMPIKTVEAAPEVVVEPVEDTPEPEPTVEPVEAAPAPQDAPKPVKEAEPVTAMFARLSATIEHRLNAPTDREAEIAALEARLAEMRRNVEADALSRRVLVGAQDMATATFDQFRADLIGEDHARQTVSMLLASVGVSPAPEPVNVSRRDALREARSKSETAINTDAAVKVRKVLKTVKQKRRAARNAEVIAYLREGGTQREAAVKFDLSYSLIGQIVAAHKRG